VGQGGGPYPMSTNDPHHGQPVLTAGAPLTEAAGAMIMLHGRGANAADIIGLAQIVERADIAYLAPDAAGNAWYPRPFMTPAAGNEPYLSSAKGVVARIISEIELGGRCLRDAEAARNAVHAREREKNLELGASGTLGDETTVAVARRSALTRLARIETHPHNLRRSSRHCVRGNQRAPFHAVHLSRTSRNQKGCAIIRAGAANWRGDDAGRAC